MPRIRPLKKDEVPPVIRQPMEQTERAMGQPLIPQGVQAYCPAIFEACGMLGGAPAYSPISLSASGPGKVIPLRSNRFNPRVCDAHSYRDRNLIERFFNRLKRFRRIASPYGKLARNYLSLSHILCAHIWLA